METKRIVPGLAYLDDPDGLLLLRLRSISL